MKVQDIQISLHTERYRVAVRFIGDIRYTRLGYMNLQELIALREAARG